MQQQERLKFKQHILPWLLTILAMAFTFSLIGCSPEQAARDSIAAATGVLAKAQTQHQAGCTADPAAQECILINRGVTAQNAATTSLEIYCGWSLTGTLPDRSAACEVKGASLAQLKAAINNLDQLTKEIKGVVK